MKEFHVWPELQELFQAWIRQNNLARFDCFLDPSTECDCYTCETIPEKMEAYITYFEARQDSLEKQAIQDMDVIAPFEPFMELPSMSMFQMLLNSMWIFRRHSQKIYVPQKLRPLK